MKEHRWPFTRCGIALSFGAWAIVAAAQTPPPTQAVPPAPPTPAMSAAAESKGNFGNIVSRLGTKTQDNFVLAHLLKNNRDNDFINGTQKAD